MVRPRKRWEMDPRGEVIVVVGGAGFLGSALVSLLVSLGAKVYVLDNFSRGPRKEGLVRGARYSQGNVGDDASHLSTCKSYFRAAKAVINLAASVGGISYNLNHQLEMLHQNTELQLVPLMAAEMVGVQHFIQVSSVCVYSPSVQDGTPVKEEVGLLGDVQGANRGYALAKRIGEEAALLAENIERTMIVRPSNIAGPNDYYDEKSHVIPALVRRAIEEEVLHVYSPGTIVREFIHPYDVATGIVRVLTLGKDREVYNVGNSNNVVSIAEVVGGILKLTNQPDKEVVYHGDEVSGDLTRSSDITKLMGLGWYPSRGIDKILEDEVNGFK